MQPKTRFTVKSAVLSIVALAAVVMAALIGIGVYSQNVQEALHEEVRREEQLVLALDRLEIAFLEARRAEKDFLLRRDEKYAGRHAGIMDRMEAGRAEAEDLMRRGTRLSTAEMEAFETALQEYRAAFAALALGECGARRPVTMAFGHPPHQHHHYSASRLRIFSLCQ